MLDREKEKENDQTYGGIYFPKAKIDEIERDIEENWAKLRRRQKERIEIEKRLDVMLKESAEMDKRIRYKFQESALESQDFAEKYTDFCKKSQNLSSYDDRASEDIGLTWDLVDPKKLDSVWRVLCSIVSQFKHNVDDNVSEYQQVKLLIRNCLHRVIDAFDESNYNSAALSMLQEELSYSLNLMESVTIIYSEQ